MAELLKRVQNCENKLTEKEKDLAHMKYDMHEMKRRWDEKENEVTALKMLNEEIRHEIDETKKVNEELKGLLYREVETLETKDRKLETRMELLEYQLTDNAKTLGDEFDSLVTKINSNKTTIKEYKDSSASKKQLDNFKANVTNKITALKEKGISKPPTPTPPPVPKNDPNAAQALETINRDFAKLKTRVETFEKHCTSFRKDLVSHLENLENITFCHEAYKEKNIKLKWVMTNFQHHYKSGGVVFSPIFYTHLQGYCYKLYVRWSGDDKENLGLYLLICQNRNNRNENNEQQAAVGGACAVDPFRIEYDLEIQHKDGSSKAHRITFADLDKHRELCFTILPDMNVATNGLGPPSMLTKPTWSDYVIHDMMYITCTFKICEVNAACPIKNLLLK